MTAKSNTFMAFDENATDGMKTRRPSTNSCRLCKQVRKSQRISHDRGTEPWPSSKNFPIRETQKPGGTDLVSAG